MLNLDATPEGQDWIKSVENLARQLGIPDDEVSLEAIAERTGMTVEELKRMPYVQRWLKEQDNG